MAKPDRTQLRVVCPHCGAELKALAAQAGTRCACPQCREIMVLEEGSTTAQAARKGRTRDTPRQGTGRAATDAADPSQIRIAIVCRRCDTRMLAARSQVGTMVVCPKCGTSTGVPTPAAAAPKPAPRPPEDDDSLELSEPEDADDLVLPDVHIRVVCRRCDTRMLAARSQVGTKIVCPDCRTSTVVPPPAAAAPKRKPRMPEDSNDSLELVDPAEAGDLTLPDVHIPVVCPLCDTRMLAARGQVGTKIVCPDCRTSTVVPSPPPTKQKPTLLEDDGEPLEVCDPIDRPPARVLGYEPDRTGQGTAVADDGGRQGRAHGADLRRPRLTFFSGIYSFPFHSGVWQRWVVFSLVLALDLILVSAAVHLSRAHSIPAWIGCLFCAMVVSVIALLWMVTALTSCLAVLQDTATGNDEIGWPDALWIDWVQDTLYVVNSLFLSALAGYGVARLLDLVGHPQVLVLPATVLFLFPIVLLSMLEAASPTTALTRPVVRCLVAGWWAWLVVYLQTAILVAVAGWITWRVAAYGGLPAVAPLSPLFVAVLLVYFRLWGRLAWCCAQRFAPEDEWEEDVEDTAA